MKPPSRLRKCKALCLPALLLFDLTCAGPASVRRDARKPAGPAEELAVAYLRAWADEDYGEMWELLDHDSAGSWWPAESSRAEFEKVMGLFPIPVRDPRIGGVQREGTARVIVKYSIDGPTLGCVTLILRRETDLRVYPYLLSQTTAYMTLSSELEIDAAKTPPRITFDRSDYYIPIHGVGKAADPVQSLMGGSVYAPGETLCATVNTMLALKNQVGAREWMDRMLRESADCFKGRRLVRPRF